MTIAIAGKNDIAVNALEYVRKYYDNEQLVVVCNRNESGKNDWQKSLRYFARFYGIKEVQLEELYDCEDLFFFSLEFDQIVKPERFKSNQLFNIHFSLLPKFKGMYTSVMPILCNEQESGVTLHRIEKGIDTGAIIDQISFEIEYMDTSLDVYYKCLKNAYDLFKRNLESIFKNQFEEKNQSIYNSTYFSKKTIDYSNLEIDINQTANNIHNQVRAFSFRPYQLPVVFGYKIVNTVVTDIKSTGKAGVIVFENDDYIVMNTIDYDIVLIKDRFTDLLNECKNGDLDSVKQISSIEHFINDKDVEHGWSALMVASYYGKTDIVKYLIAKGANVNIKNHNGTNLLMYAKNGYLNTGDAEVFELLTRMGIDYKEKDYLGKSLREYCEEQGVNKIGNIDIVNRY